MRASEKGFMTATEWWMAATICLFQKLFSENDFEKR
jgi:hypothetical protein